uniref:NET domain-containing protein n=1 Tax=Triticum urartu TaxID=4572 RepID=A0A8R7PUK0_TRIUA
MPGPKRAPEMEILRRRFQSELVAVRGLLHKAAAVLVPASSPSAPRVRSRPRFLAEEPPAKKRKAPPSIPVINRKKAATKTKMTASEREMLAEELELFVAEIPDHVVELLKKQSCATRPDEIEIDIHALDDAAVVELQERVDKFARERRSNPLPQERHQDGPKVMAEEEEEYVDICGGVSPLAIVPQPLLQERHQDGRKAMAEEEEEEEDVDICGGVSPLPIVPAPLLLVEDKASGSPSSSSTDSSDSDSDTDSDSSDSGSEHSGSSSGSDSDSDEIVDGPAPAIAPPTCEQLARALERQRKEATSRAREKARQEVLQTERMAMPDDTLHPEDLKTLGIDEYNTARPNNLLRQIGLYLKLDDDRKHHHHHQIFEEDLEEGEIR